MASSAPLEKRAKSGESSQISENEEEVHAALEEIDNCQSQIDNLNDLASDEILKVEMRYNELRKPHYVKRGELISHIPNFWVTAFMNHPQLSLLINDEEQVCLRSLKNLDVEEFEDIKHGYKIIFNFDTNPYFENDTLVKEYHLMGPNGNPKMITTPIVWKPNKNFLSNGSEKDSRKRKSTDSFFSWFVDAKNITMDEIADLIKDEIWPNPLQFFLLPEVEEDNGDEDSDADEEAAAEDGDEEDGDE